jgi:hypothetical protein
MHGKLAGFHRAVRECWECLRAIEAATHALGISAAPGSLQLPPRRIACGAANSDVLIDQNRVPVWIHGNKAGGPGRMLICLIHEHDALGLQLALQIANVGEGA